MSMTLSQARVVDPVLSTVAQGYQNNELIFRTLFPVVPVEQRGGNIIEFGREDFQRYNTARAPGAATKRVEFGYSGKPYALVDHSLEGKLPFELMQEANAVPGIDLGKIVVMKTQAAIQIGNELRAAALATTAAHYAASNRVTLAGTSQWSHASSTPSVDIQTASDAVRAAVGKRPNTVVLGPRVWSALKQHPQMIERLKYTGRDSLTLDMLAALWDVRRVVVGDAVFEDDTGAIRDVWGNSVVVAYTDTSGLNDGGLPSYGYTYRLRNYPLVETPYSDRNSKSWIYPVTDSLAPVIACANAGYLISAAVA